MSAEVVPFHLNGPQWAFWQSTARYVDLEGGVRSGKTTVAVLKLLELLQEHPGLHALAARWTQDATDAQLKPRIRELLESALLRWHADEEFFDVRSIDPAKPSRLYVRGLKASEDSARYSKFAGLTLGTVYVDQAEELPEDFYRALQARLSQPNFPQRLIVTPNPPGTGHWLEQEFPEDNTQPGRHYIRTTVYDNRSILGEDYIAALEAAYPTPAQKRFFIWGRRGLSILGEAVYGKVFDRKRHVRDVPMNPEVPLLEAWDFGQHHPAVLWGQLVGGQLRLLGELMGRDQFLEDFAHQAKGVRAMLFPQPLDVWACCDPAGADRNSQGLSKNAVQVLQEAGVAVRWVPGANHPAQRDHAIQRVAQHMLLYERFIVHPRCTTLIDGLEAGYVWDDRSIAHSTLPNTRRPKKDGHYDHLQNCLEYLLLNFGSAQPTRKEQDKQVLQSLRAAQRDLDPYDRYTQAAYRGARGGY